ncbi:ATP-binding protein, partial [Endozoicomonas sp. ONNA2]|uniref:ATP-binding protein n=1 Tax=Endozoicomonas sp. ONNA2 TaxID=2828741 RepID=UPI002147CC85
KRPDKYAKKKIHGPSPILLYGKPGCGKTSAVKKLVDFIGIYKFEIKLSAVGSKYVHETSCKISEIFRSANILAPSVVIIDEVDTLLSQSLKQDSIRGEEVATLLDLIGEAEKNKILVIGMTNNLEVMSDAAKRPGRFTYHFKVEPLGNGGDVKELLANCWDTISIASNVNIDVVAQMLATRQGGCTVADVYGFSREVCMRAVRQDKEDVDKQVVQEVLDEYLQKKS